MLCKLCNQEKRLRDSHIIPKYFIKRISPTDGTALIEVASNSPHIKRRPIGYYEKLLCEDCENLTARWDDAGIKFFQKTGNWKKVSNLAYYEVEDYDYSQLKLFFMSILWRASVSTHPIFSEVKLGGFQQRLLKLLQQSNPSDPDDFGVVLFKYAESENELEKIILGPTRYKPNGINHYRFKLNEFVFNIKVDKQPFTPNQKLFSLKKTPPLLIVEVEHSQSRELKNMIEAVGLQTKLKSQLQKNFKRIQY